jgi:hypothetical protein
MVFPEEQALLNQLVDEWYQEIKNFTELADGIFSERGAHLDKHSPPWMRHDYPHGYPHEMGKKVARIKQFMQEEEVPWNKVLDELKDICNYSRMMAAVVVMLDKRRMPGLDKIITTGHREPPIEHCPWCDKVMGVGPYADLQYCGICKQWFRRVSGGEGWTPIDVNCCPKCDSIVQSRSDGGLFCTGCRMDWESITDYEASFVGRPT